MKSLLRFKKYLLLTVLAYTVVYITYSLAVLTEKVDIYFVLALVLFVIMLYWVIVGIYSPSKLPFWKVKSRLLVILIGAMCIFTIAGCVIATEIFIFRRSPVYTLYKNVHYLYYGYKEMHPFADR